MYHISWTCHSPIIGGRIERGRRPKGREEEDKRAGRKKIKGSGGRRSKGREEAS